MPVPFCRIPDGVMPGAQHPKHIMSRHRQRNVSSRLSRGCCRCGDAAGGEIAGLFFLPFEDTGRCLRGQMAQLSNGRGNSTGDKTPPISLHQIFRRFCTGVKQRYQLTWRRSRLMWSQDIDRWRDNTVSVRTLVSATQH
jgi:hypothetical protein